MKNIFVYRIEITNILSLSLLKSYYTCKLLKTLSTNLTSIKGIIKNNYEHKMTV